MSHVPAPGSTPEASGAESGPVSDRDAQDAREARYGGAWNNADARWCEGETRTADADLGHDEYCARAVIAVADSELAPLVARVAELEAEVERTRRGRGRALLRWKHWWDRAERAEAALARVEALANDLLNARWLFDEDRDTALRGLGNRLHTLAAAGPAVSDGPCAFCRGCHPAELDHCLRLPGCTPAVSDGEGATREAVRRATFAEVSRAMNRTANVWEDDGSDPCRVRITREYANAYRAYAEGLGEPTGSKGF